VNASKLKRALKQIEQLQRGLTAIATKLATVRSGLENEVTASQAIGNASAKPARVRPAKVAKPVKKSTTSLAEAKRDKAEKRVGKVKPAAKPVAKSDKKEKRPQ
jgi:hypothetical protein